MGLFCVWESVSECRYLPLESCQPYKEKKDWAQGLSLAYWADHMVTTRGATNLHINDRCTNRALATPGKCDQFQCLFAPSNAPLKNTIPC